MSPEAQALEDQLLAARDAERRALEARERLHARVRELDELLIAARLEHDQAASKATELEIERDHLDLELAGAKADIERLCVEGVRLEAELERFEREAIVVVPVAHETREDTLRRRIRKLESQTSRLEVRLRVSDTALEAARPIIAWAKKVGEHLIAETKDHEHPGDNPGPPCAACMLLAEAYKLPLGIGPFNPDKEFLG